MVRLPQSPKRAKKLIMYKKIDNISPKNLNLFVRLRVQLDVHGFICILYSFVFFSLHVSGAICTHPQERKLQRTGIGVCVCV
jgi:hypothetical protein